MSPVIEVRDLVRRYGSFTAVDRVSFDVERGEIFGYLGANGAGKSTTIRMLTGLVAPTEGDALVAGHRISQSPESVKSSIGYMSQKFSLYLDITVDANLEFFGGAYGLSGRHLRARIDAMSERAGLQGIRDARTGQLPGGLRQRVALAASLLHEPQIVFLDEPTAGVDPSSRREFWNLIRDLAASGTTVFVTTHYMDEAEYCARVGLMVAGRLVALDTPRRLAEEHVPGRMFNVSGLGLLRALPALRALPGVLAADPFGSRLHVRVEPSLTPERLRVALAGGGATELVLEPGQANLEDVFLALAGGTANDG